MYYIYTRTTAHRLIAKTNDINTLGHWPSNKYEVVMFL